MIQRFDSLPYLTLKTNSRDEVYSRRAHSHREISLGYIEKGSTLIEVDRQEYRLGTGDMVLVPAEKIHICRPDDPDDYSFRMFYLDPEWWRRNFEIENFRTLAIPAPLSLKEFIQRLHSSALPETSDLTGVIQATLLPLLRSVDAEEDPALKKIHRKIREMPQIPFGIEDFAAQAGMNKFSFIRKYARIYGLTPHADMVNMRIQRAILLFERDLPLTEISFECGFTDQSHFIKQFKLYTGMKPGEYRSVLKK